jgi:hypothetical protein
MTPGPSSMMLAGIVKDQLDLKTLLSFSQFSNDGTHMWDYFIEQDQSIISSYYEVHQIKL